MPDLTTKDAMLERMVTATDNMATNMETVLGSCSRVIKMTTSVNGTFRITGGKKFAAILTFISTSARNLNRIFFLSGYGTGGTSRSKYYMLPTDTGEGNFSVAIEDSVNAYNFTVNYSSTPKLDTFLTVLGEDPEEPVEMTFTAAS